MTFGRAVWLRRGGMMTHKHLFSRALAAAPGRLHFAAHSHHLWPDAGLDAHARAASDAITLADRKWDTVMGQILPAARRHIAQELALPLPDSIAFAPNTHEFIVRMRSCFPAGRPLRVLTSDGEFHSLSRQLQRWEETGDAVAQRVAVAPVSSVVDRLLGALDAGTARGEPFDWVFVSQVFFNSGHVLDAAALTRLAAGLEADPDTWLIVDGYHGFMAVETDFSPLADRAFYMAGGYKYAMAGEGACFLHAPPGYGARPGNTGWFAAFEAVADAGDGRVGFADHGGRFTGSTFDPSGLYRFVGVRDMLASQGLSTGVISAHVRGLQDQFVAAVTAGRAGELIGAERVGDFNAPNRARFLAYRHRRAAQWCARLGELGVVTDVRGDVIRFGFGIYQDGDDVAALIDRCARACTPD